MATGVVDITLTPRQKEAVSRIEEWYKKDNEQIFTLAGYAGTGKTTIVQYAIENLGLDKKKQIAFCAFTGKAALVLTQKSKGEYTASTIHSLIYALDDSQKVASFVLRDKKDLEQYKLIVVDEASMVSKNILDDLMYFGIKILAIGDQGQLDPVGDNFSELLKNPDFTLEEIHRQAEGNPIIHISFLARSGQYIKPGKYGSQAYVLRKNDIPQEKLLDIYLRSDQVLCGYNRTRVKINHDIRKRIGRESSTPVVGDKIICTKNSWSETLRNGIALVNGMTGFIEDIYAEDQSKEIKREAHRLNFRPDFTEDIFYSLIALQDDFAGNDIQLEREEYQIYERFNYAWAITTHKSQGSQWKNVTLVNEVLNRETHHRWLYTGITRASENLLLIV